MRALLLGALLLSGCLGGQEGADAKEFGCAPMHILTLTEGPSPPGEAIAVAGAGNLSRFPLGFVQVADHLAAQPAESRSAWQDIGYQARQAAPGATEVWLSPLEWFGLVMILDDAAVAQGAQSVGPLEDSKAYRFHVAAGERTFRFDLDVRHC